MRKTIRSLILLLLSIVIACPPTYAAPDQVYALVKNPQNQNNSQSGGSMIELSEVLNSFESKYKVNFNYNPELIKEKKVKLDNVSNNSDQLDKILNNILHPLKLNYEKLEEKTYVIYEVSEIEELKSKNFMRAPGSNVDEGNLQGRGMDQRALNKYNFADITINGKVTNELGEPLPGVTVIAKESPTVGTQTDVEGNYNLSVPNATTALIFSYIGFISEEMPINSQSVINVSLLPDIAALQEVVVVGYGTQQKKEVTGAIATVKGTDILKSSAVSVSNSLAGRVPGLIVNQRNAEPGRDDATILIRGVSTIGNSSALIVIDGVANRDGISRIDPNDIESVTVLKDASAAIYGAQAANGVILITTKRGKAGKPSINYSFNQGYVSPTRFIKMSDAATYARSINDLNRQAGQALTFSEERVLQYQNGELPSTNWLDESFNSYSLQNRHSLTISGGTEAIRYFISGGTAFQGGLLKDDETTKYKQYNIRSNIDANITKRLTVGLDLAARRENRNFLQLDPNIIYQNAVLGDPTAPATINGLPARGRQNNNPLAIVQGPGYDKTERNVLNGTFKFDYKLPFIEGLSVDGFGAVDLFQDFRKIWAQPHTFYEANANGDVVPLKSSISPTLTETFVRSQSITLNAKIKYERVFGDHNVAAFMAYEQNETVTDSLAGRRTGFESDQVDQMFAGSQSNQFANGSARQGARQNYFGRVSYGFKNKYLAQVHFRYDGSQIFPSGKRFGFFPGVSLGWRISEEAFLKEIPVISNLKLRASWGKLGNDKVNPYQYLNIFTFGSGYVFNGQDVLALNPGVAANPNITWERQTNIDIGLEAGFFNNRVTFEGDFFTNKRTDILTRRNITVPQYTGLSLPNENIGEVENKGFDAQLLYNNTISDVKFSVGGNITYARNKVIFIDEGDTYAESYQKQEGQPIGSVLAYEVIGIYQEGDDLTKGLSGSRVGDFIYKDVNGDGIVNSDDMVRQDRSATPQLQYGFTLNAEYKGFDFSALLQGQALASQELTYNFSAGSNGPEYFLQNAWTPENTSASLPRIGRSKETNNVWIRDVSFLRLKNIELGYSLPLSIISKAGIERLRFYVNGYNLLTFDNLKKDGMPDPENVNIQSWQFPHTKSVNFGLNLTF